MKKTITAVTGGHGGMGKAICKELGKTSVIVLAGRNLTKMVCWSISPPLQPTLCHKQANGHRHLRHGTNQTFTISCWHWQGKQRTKKVSFSALVWPMPCLKSLWSTSHRKMFPDLSSKKETVSKLETASFWRLFDCLKLFFQFFQMWFQKCRLRERCQFP